MNCVSYFDSFPLSSPVNIVNPQVVASRASRLLRISVANDFAGNVDLREYNAKGFTAINVNQPGDTVEPVDAQDIDGEGEEL